MPSPKQVLVGVLGLGLSVTGLSLAPAPAQANPAGTGLVISEVYGAGGNSGALYNADFVELYNPTDAAIPLTGMSIQYRSATGGAGAPPFALSGEVPAESHFLIQMSNTGANGDPLPLPDAVASPAFALGASGGRVALVNGTTQFEQTGDVAGNPVFVDMVGELGAATYETADAGEDASAANSLNRDLTGADTDNNGPDFSLAAPTPENDGITPPLEATDPADIEANAGRAIEPVELQAVGGEPPYTWAVTAGTLPAGLTLSPDGELSGTPTTEGTANVTFTVTDSADPAATDSVDVTITVAPEPENLAIAEIQGTDTATSPEDGNVVRTEGVVTAMYRDPAFTSSSVDGMYIQTGGTGGTTDATDGASDAIFVYWGNAVAAVDGIAIGDSVEVTGEVSEFNGTTEITVRAGDVVELGSPLPAATGLEIAYPTTEEEREAQEGMLLAPTDTFTVTNVFGTNRFAEVGLATGDSPLVQPSDVAAPGTPEIEDVKADNLARGVVLDDGTSVDYQNTDAAKDQPLPWLTPDNPIRVGAEATLQAPVILEYKFNVWRFQPTLPVYGEGADVATFENTRPEDAAPVDVPGDLKLATFNVLNYFNTTGEAYEAAGPAQDPPVNTDCSFFTDRDGNPIANNTCGVVTNGNNAGNGPRGAANQVNLERQQAKIVTAINGLGADIVTLEELENSIKLVGETNRDDAIAALVEALNADAGAGTWAYVASPDESRGATNIAEQDVIRNGFIYQPASVEPVGSSDLLFGTTAFANAREPLAQAFKPTGAADDLTFAVIVNHFKSKGDSTPPATGDNANNPDTGAFNGDRVRQAEALATFADRFAAARGTDKVFLTGDFNAYDEEDPVHALEDAGFTLVESDDPEDESYSFSGLSGSLDHVFANEAALATVQGADIWEINANESVAFQYSRFNYNVTDFWQPNLPFASSDHNPEIVGFNPEPSAELPTQIQLLGTNDFHGRLLADGNNAAGAAVMAGVVKDMRAQNPNTVFAAAGDLIGASTFESFILNDKPTIDALNEAGLEVSAVGNHELDQGYDDLVNRVMADYDPTTNPEGGAEWQYIAGNLEITATGDPAVPATWTKEMDGVTVGFVGAVTEELPSLVAPGGIAELTVNDIVTSTNTYADELKADGAEIVVLLVHEGAPSTTCETMDDDPESAFGSIVTGVNENVDAIVSGHTHLAYNCSFPVQDWIDDDRDVTERPVVSAGQYGTNLNQLVFSVDPTSGDLVGIDQQLVPLPGRAPADPATQAIVDQAVEDAEPLGARKLGEMEDVFGRAKLPVAAAPPAPPLAAENRGGESTLGNLVAEVQRWATEAPESGAAQIAFMNPGGLRADMEGAANGDVRDLTYRQAANVQPFANTLVNMDLTGTQIETVLEQQWQRTTAGAVPSRPFLRLGVSEGFTYTYVETPVTVGGTATFQGEVTGMWLDGEPIDPAESYSVTVNSFLSTGGDNFHELANGTGKADTGKVDLQAMVDYMAEFANSQEGDPPLPVDYAQRAVEVEFPQGAPASYGPGDTVAFDLSSLAMSGRVNPTDPVYDLQDEEIEVQVDGETIATAPVDNTIGTAPYDQYGTASVSFALPNGLPEGEVEVLLVGPTTGTEVVVPITVEGEEVVKRRVRIERTVRPSTVVAKKTRPAVVVRVISPSGIRETGTVTIWGKGVKRPVTDRVVNGRAVLHLKPFDNPGVKRLKLRYSGNDRLFAKTVMVKIKVVRKRR